MASMGFAQSWASIQIDSTDNLSGAGNSINPTPNPGGGSGGTAASGYALQAGLGRQLKFSSVSGIVSMSANVVHSNPDGVDPVTGLPPFGIGMNVNSYDGISGVSLDKGSGFLAGVFLSSSYPSSAPADLAFSNANGSNGISTSFTSLAPQIGQIFFIGDGLTGNGTGVTQKFEVPDSAVTLYLGFTDAAGYQGAPGQFQDNFGSFTADFAVEAVPEPGTFLAIGLGMLALRRKRKAA